MDDQERQERAKRLGSMTLPVLIARLGGSVTVTHAEFDEVAARYGGRTNMVMYTEALSNDSIRLTLMRKRPANAELPQ